MRTPILLTALIAVAVVGCSSTHPGGGSLGSSEARVRAIASEHLQSAHQSPKAAIRIEAVSKTGDDFLVFATIANATSYRLIVSPSEGRVLSERVIVPLQPAQPHTAR